MDIYIIYIYIYIYIKTKNALADVFSSQPLGSADPFRSTTNIEIKLNPEFEGHFKIMMVPNITNICYGRGVGYKIEEIELSKEIQEISATKLRAEMRKDGKLK